MRGYANRPEDIWERVAAAGPDECWPFVGACNAKGYGQMRIGGHQLAAHRIAFQVATGTDPGLLLVCHACDNPPCCNPAHLFLGTHLYNNRDCKAKGRNTAGVRHPNAKLTEAQVAEIRRRRASGEMGIDVAAAFGITPAMVSRIVRGLNWTGVAA